MASATHSAQLQDDWSGGSVPAVAPHLVPFNAAAAISDGFVNEDGSVYQRGGAEAISPAAFGDSLTFLHHGNYEAGVRTLFANDDDFGVLASDDSVVNLGNDGMPYPKPVATHNSYSFIGGGYIYAGSRKSANYTTGTVSVTNGSTTVTGSGTTWNTLVDAGMLFQRGNERVYRIASVDSTTQVTLAEAYEGATGSGLAYTFSPVYSITSADPYPDSDVYAVAQNRLVWAEGRKLRFAPLVEGFPANHRVHTATDEWDLAEEIIGIGEVGANALVFTAAGTFILQGIGYDIVDFAGNPQQRLTKLSDHVLLSGAGLSYWEQALIVPTTDGVYFMDGVGQPVKLSDNIETTYQRYVRKGYRAGQACVYNSHYFLPLVSGTAVPKRLYACQLDRQAFDRRRRLTFPWSWHTGNGAQLVALNAALEDDREPRLIGAQGNSTCRVVDASYFFTPDSDHQLDPDGSEVSCDIITRDYATGGATDNAVKKVRTRYEMSGTDPSLEVSYSTGALDTGQAKWGQAQWGQFQWGQGDSGFLSLNCDGADSDGRDTHTCRVGKRTRFIRFRYRTRGQISAFRLRSLELFTKPSRATRR